jgi:ABC-type oligopeptide transport system substrate-binding subunit
MLKMLRRLGLISSAALALSACKTETISYIEVPVPTAKPAYTTNARPGGQRLMTIDRLYAWCDKGLLLMQVTGSANTGGWSDARLNRISNQGGLLTYELIAQPPQRGDDRTIQQFTIQHDDAWPNEASRVRVISQTNEMTSVIAPCPAYTP